VAEHPKDRADPEPEGAPTELDVKLPSKIALAHAEETLEQRTTLPRVPLPSRAEILLTPVRPSSPGLPPFNSQSFPPPARSPASPTGPHQLPSRRATTTGPHQLPSRPRATNTGPHQLPPRTRAEPTGPHAPVATPGRPLATGPHLLPEFDSRSSPPLDAEFYRPTETVRTLKLRRGGIPWIVLMLLGVALGTGVTVLLLRWLQ
jgi:hypothetical protein